MDVSGVLLKAVTQKYCWPSSRCNYGIKLKIIHRFILELSHSQTWVSTPPAQQGVGKNLILLLEVSCRNYFLSSVYISQTNSSGDGGHPLVFTPCHKISVMSERVVVIQQEGNSSYMKLLTIFGWSFVPLS